LAVTAEEVKALRERTGAGVMDCKKALEDAEGNVEKACGILSERGLARAEKRAGRIASQGAIDAYIHAGGRIGSMVEVNCETDFVARTDVFRELVHNRAMQVAATGPRYVERSEMPADSTEEPAEVCLLEQPFIREPSKTVRDVVIAAIVSLSENIKVRRFVRFELGKED